MKAKRSAPKLSPSQRKKWLENLQSFAKPTVATGSENKQAKYRFVVDTNVLISALLYSGRPQEVVDDIMRNHALILSDHIIDELVAYLKVVRPKLPQKWIRGLREQLQKYCYEYDTAHHSDIRDPKDNPITALAYAQNAIIITGDKDILEHQISDKFAVLSTAEYKELFANK